MFLLVFRNAVASLLPSLQTFGAQASIMDAFDEDFSLENALRHYFWNKHAVSIVELLLLRSLAHIWLAEKWLYPLLVTGPTHGSCTSHRVSEAHTSWVRAER